MPDLPCSAPQARPPRAATLIRRIRPAKPAAANGAQPADAAKDNQRKTDEFVEAAQALNGPAGNPECVWLGRRVVRLMWLDDLDTAFRHLDLYDRFGCPGGHVQATFRCLTRFGGQIDPKVAETLNSRVQACWINPAAQPQTAARCAAARCSDHRRQRGACCRPRPCGSARGRSGACRPNKSPASDGTDGNFTGRDYSALKTPWRRRIRRHKSC